MTLLRKAGSGSVDPVIFNDVVDAEQSGIGVQVTAADIDSQAAADGDVLTADGAGNAAWEPSTGGGATFATPAIALGTAAAAGAAATVIRSDSTIVAFDATAPTTQAFADAAAVGTADVAARRDHKHAMMPAPTTVSGNAGTATALATSRNIDGQAFNGTADITVIAPGTHAATSKTPPVDADEIPLVDSAASNALKKLTWANLKATIKAYTDTLYTAIGASAPPNGNAGGDLTGTYPNPTLATAGGGAAGPLGSATVTPIVTVDAKGRVTALTSATTAPTNAAGGDLTGNYPNPTLATAGGGAAGPLGSATVTPIVTVDAKGRVTALTSATTVPTNAAGGDLTGNYPNPTLGSGAFATPAVVLGTAAAAGASTDAVRTDSTIVAFDATAPTTQNFADAAAVGVIAFAARRDHKHAWPTVAASRLSLGVRDWKQVSFFGASVIAEAIPRWAATTNTTVLTTARLSGQAIPVLAGDVITSVGFCSATTALSAQTNWWFALCDSSYNVIRQSTDQITGGSWASNSAKTLTTDSIPVTAGARVASTTVTLTIPTLSESLTSLVAVSDSITVSNANVAAYNGTFTVASVSATQITYVSGGSATDSLVAPFPTVRLAAGKRTYTVAADGYLYAVIMVKATVPTLATTAGGLGATTITSSFSGDTSLTGTCPSPVAHGTGLSNQVAAGFL